MWDRRTGEPVGPGIGWQDLRTVGTCLVLRDQGIRVAPNESATKLAMLLDMADPDRTRDLCFGTVDTWVAWTLSGGALHVTDATNAGVTGLLAGDGSGLGRRHARRAAHPPERAARHRRLVGRGGRGGRAAGRPGDLRHRRRPAGVARRPGLHPTGAGQGHLRDGRHARPVRGHARPGFARRGGAGTFPIVAWQRAGHKTWGVEAVMLLGRHVRGVAARRPRHHRQRGGLASRRRRVRRHRRRVVRPRPARARGAGVGLRGARHLRGDHARHGAAGDGASRARGRGPSWRGPVGVGRGRHRHDRRDPARGRRHVGQPHLRRARWPTRSGRPVEISPVTEATTLGAAYLAGIALGVWADEDDVAAAWKPSAVVEPRATDVERATTRARWLAARERARATVPELTALEF